VIIASRPPNVLSRPEADRENINRNILSQQPGSNMQQDWHYEEEEVWVNLELDGGKRIAGAGGNEACQMA
jgi:hypothetical protein